MNKRLIALFAMILIISILVININAAPPEIPDTVTVTDVSSGPNPAASTPTATSSATQEMQIGNEEKNVGKFIGLESAKDGDIVGKNIKLVKKDGKTTVSFNENSYVKIKIGDKWISYGNLKKLEGIRIEKEEISIDPKMVIDNKGQVIEAYFTIGDAGEYAFGNEKINLPKDTRVYYKKGEALIGVSEGTKITGPTKIDSKKAGGKFVFQTTPGGSLKLENDYEIKGAKVIYNDGKLGFSVPGKEVLLRQLTIRTKNPDQMIYLDFEGKVSDVDGTFISMNENEKRIAIGSNTNEAGPAIMFNKDNPYGKKIEATDHFAVKALGAKEKGKSYIMIENKDRESKDLVPKETIVGAVAINQDDRGIGTFLGDDKFYLKVSGKIIDEFSDIPAASSSTTVPGEMHVFTKQGEKLTGMYNNDWSFVMGNNHELGWGPEPSFIRGSPYFSKYPLIARGVSNKVSYNYISYTKEGFEQYTKLTGREMKLNLDSYSASRMTPDQYRMLIDWYNTLPANKANLRRISIVQTATSGGYAALAWGGPGGIQISYRALTPYILRHEATHSATMSTSGFFSAWKGVGGGRTGSLISNYATEDSGEHASDFAGYLMYDPKKTVPMLQSNKYIRGQMAVMAKYNIISMEEYNFYFKSAGLDPSQMDKYIQEART